MHSNANSRDQIIRAQSDSASASLGRLNTLAANSRSVPYASFGTLNHNAAAVLQNQQREYRALAEKANRRVRDALMLQ